MAFVFIPWTYIQLPRAHARCALPCLRGRFCGHDAFYSVQARMLCLASFGVYPGCHAEMEMKKKQESQPTSKL